MEEVTIIGAGHQGLAMAAHLSLNQVDCYLWNRSAENIKSILRDKKIICDGIVKGIAEVKEVSTNIQNLIKRVIMVTTPSSAHEDIAAMLAPFVTKDNIIILNPGRTFGAMHFVSVLKRHGCKEIPIVAETQTIVYTCRRNAINEVNIYAFKKNVGVAAYSEKDIGKVLDAIPRCLKQYFVQVPDCMITSMSNVGMVLHCAPVLMNIGWIESEKTEFKYYYDGISPSIADVLERIDAERCKVADAMGIKVPTLREWLYISYAAEGDNLYEQLQNNSYYREIDAPKTISHRYLEEDIPNGLVAVETAGNYHGVETPTISTIIDVANIVMKKDYRVIGRNYIKLIQEQG